MEEEIDEGLPRVLTVVVTHEGRPWLRESLSSLAAQDYPALDIFVFDNASTRSPKALVSKVLPRAEFHRSDSNLGFGAAANRALELSGSAPDCDYYLFLHDDAALEEDCVSKMVLAALETGAGAVGGKGLAWNESGVLVEAGMSADQFGYPFTGLEEGEIDQGQHDERREVLYVTSACILVSRSLVERTGSWDTGFFVFGEDLDLCIRGRLAGYPIVFEPHARFRHVAALSNRVREARNIQDIRFYTRRNRLRTILKNLSVIRAVLLLPIYLAVMTAEVVLLVALRRFDEVGAYPKAIASFLGSVPDVLRRRRAVQRRRAIPDRRLRRLMVSDLHRARIFLERRLREWEQETVEFGEMALSRFAPSAIRDGLIRVGRRSTTPFYAVVGILLIFVCRHLLAGPDIAAGGLWPFPEDSFALLREYVAGWRDIGLGSEAAPSPVLPLAWVVSLVGFGGPRGEQSITVILLLALGIIGMARLVARRSSLPWSRLVAVVIYSFGPVVAFILEEGDLGALAVYAGLPWMLEVALRMLGPTPRDHADRPATPLLISEMLRDQVRLALITALVVAAAPSAWVLFVAAWVLLALASVVKSWDRHEARRRATWLVGSAVVAAVLLLPWSVEGLRPSGVISGPLFSGLGGGPLLAPGWTGNGFAEFLLANPGAAGWGGLAAAAVLLGSLVLIPAGRRREVTTLVLPWLGFAAWGGLAARGLAPAPTASSAMWLVLPHAFMALAAGHLVAGLRHELPRHSVGWRHTATAVVILAVAGAAGIAWVPAAADVSRPESTSAADTSEQAHSILSFFTSTAEDSEEFRVLWLGDAYVEPIASAIRPLKGARYIVTGSAGISLLDIYPPPASAGERRLETLVDSLVARRLHLAGHVLAPANIRYIVVPENDPTVMGAMGRQRDIALQQQQGGVAIFENKIWIPRATLASEPLAEAAAVEAEEEIELMLADWTAGRSIPRVSPTRFTGAVPEPGRPRVLLADNFNRGWEATIAGRALDHRRTFGWANGFELDEDDQGRLEIVYTASWQRWLWILAQVAIVLLAILMARGGRGELKGWLR